MKKFFLNTLAIAAMLCVSFGAKAVGWPANYQGVMLQGFYWDSYKGTDNTKWSTLTNKADELSQYFKLIWVPNSAKANGEGGGGNGYMPIYWFTNHNCAFGTESELKTMISTYKAKGVGFIEDVVVNHRVGSSNWYNFPSETWNGKTWQLTNGAICSTDEMWKSGGQGCPYTKGNPDTGEDFDGARDLDHTNATVQDHVKNYCKFLIDDLGYVGFRLDMVKGYGGQYTKIYNQYSKPTYSVGEYFDGSYDAVSAWIEATGRESAAFDFPFKYAVNEAFSSNDMRKLVWKNLNTNEDQPAGLIHCNYQQFAVTFIDNHDTYRDSWNKFNGNVVAANAFMLCSPGTPCVFWPHYTQNKSAIQALINVRNQVGVHNQSPVKVLKLEQNCYMAEVTGTNGKLVVRIGSTSDSPSGGNYSLKCSGNGYAVWATTQGGVTPTPDPGGNTGGNYPSTLYLMGNVNGAAWATDKGEAATGTNGVFNWPNVTINAADGETNGFFSFSTTLGADWDAVNNGDRFGAASKDEPIALGGSSTIVMYTANVNASGCQSWKIAPGNYSITANLANMTVTIATAGTKPETGGGNTSNGFNVYFDNTTSQWQTPHIHYWGASESTWPGVAMQSYKDNVWVYKVPAGTTGILFNAGDGDATKTSDFAAAADHVYTTAGDQGVYPDASKDDPTPSPNPGNYPPTLYLIGNINGMNWNTASPIAAQSSNGHYKWTAVTFDDAGDGSAYFSFLTATGADWDVVNEFDRYGSEAFNTGAENTDLPLDTDATIVLFPAQVNAMGATAWKVVPGTFDVYADLAKMKVRLTKVGSGVDGIDSDDAPVYYFNLQGVRVENPTRGIYIRVRGNKTEKVVL